MNRFSRDLMRGVKAQAPASQNPRAHRTAEEAWIDSAVFAVSPEAHAAFLARLDAPPEPNDRLRRTMQAVPPWE